MIIKELAAQKRTDKGTAKVKRLRKAGMIPGIIYGRHLESAISVSVEKQEFTNLINRIEWESSLINLNLEGAEQEVILKKVEYDTYKHNIIHFDMFAIKRGEKIDVKIPIVLTGEAIGLEHGGIVDQMTKDLHVKCLPKDLIDHFMVDITALDMGDYIKVRDIDADLEKFEVLSSPDETVILIATPAKLIEPTIDEEELEGEEGVEEGAEEETEGTQEEK